MEYNFVAEKKAQAGEDYYVNSVSDQMVAQKKVMYRSNCLKIGVDCIECDQYHQEPQGKSVSMLRNVKRKSPK